MTVRSYERLNCPIAKSLAVVGDQWTLMILRDLLAGDQRFDSIQSSLGISRNLLSARLKSMEADGLIERVRLPGSKRYAYRATEKGRDLRITLLALAQWAERWRAEPEMTRLTIRDKDSHAPVRVGYIDASDRREIDPQQVQVIRRSFAQTSAG